MKRVLPLFLALSLAPVLPLMAQPDATAPATPMAAPDAAAVALLDKAAAAYAAAPGLAMHFEVSDVTKDKTEMMSGDFAYAKPGKGKVSLKKGDKPTLLVADGKTLWSQQNGAYTKSNAGEASVLPALVSQIPSALSVVMLSLARGENPLTSQTVKLPWQDVKVLPDNGVSMAAVLNPQLPPIVFRLYFDATDNLLRRVEADIIQKGEKNTNITALTQVETNPTFAADAFVYTPPAGVKLAVEPTMYDPKLVVGAAPYALTGTDFSGKTQDWSAYKGKVVLLDFWATWCGPCVGELPNVLTNYGKYHDKGFDIVGVSLDEDKAALTGFVAARKMPWPQLFDGKGWKNVNSTAYGVRAIPFTLLIGKDGKIAAVNPRGEALEPALKAALAK